MGAIRGAVCVTNNVKDIEEKSVELIESIIKANGISAKDIDAVFFSATEDLDACYPAKSVREKLSLTNVAFMCFSEMYVAGSMRGCIRVCVFVPGLSQTNCKHCYLGKAKDLRKDLA